MVRAAIGHHLPSGLAVWSLDRSFLNVKNLDWALGVLHPSISILQ